MNNNLHVFLLLVLVIIFSACSDEDVEVEFGEDYLESKTDIVLLDTFSVELATIKMDSISSNGTGTMLLGAYEDDYFGNIHCQGFFQLGIPDDFDFELGDEYDSVSLIMEYSGYHFGDTMNGIDLEIYQLAEKIVLFDTEYLYNTSSFQRESSAIGSFNFIPFPNSDDSIEIKLDKTMGQDLFDKFVDDDDLVSTNEAFIDYFKGLTIEPSSLAKDLVIGIKANEGDAKIRLYSHRVEEETEVITNDLKLNDQELQFNRIVADFSGTNIASIGKQADALLATESNGNSYMQGGTGLFTRVRFPSLQELIIQERGVVIEAQLILYPEPGTYDQFSLIDSVILYESDNMNRLNSYLTNDYGYYFAPTLEIDELYHENTKYTFDITDFLTNELSDSYFDSDRSILVGLTPVGVMSSLERAVFSSNHQKPMLKIYYLYY